jgi:hypothetical protein
MIAAATAGVGLLWSTRIAGGSDSYCYVEQARLIAEGRLLEPALPGFDPPWPDAAPTLAPTGFVPSPTVPGAIAPICPPGLALVMAPFIVLAGIEAAYLVVPLLGAVATACTFLLGRRMGGPAGGLVAAVLLATQPAFLFQLVQPMSDVPAAAWWSLALVLATHGAERRRLVGSGLAASLAILTRPNLAPIALALPLAAPSPTPRSRAAASRAGDLAALAIGLLPGVAGVLAFQAMVHGAPWRSGYGVAGALFSREHVLPNLERYPGWLIETSTPLVLLGLLAPFFMRGEARRLAWACAAMIAGVVACYAFYTPFHDWWYLRFLVPAMPPLFALAGACAGRSLAAAAAARGAKGALLGGLAAAVCAAVVAHQAREAVERGVFGLYRAEQKFRIAGEYVGRALPPKAVIFAVWHSGSVRLYGDRPTVLWDSFDPRRLDLAVERLATRGYEPYFLFDAFEGERFRARFEGASRFGALNWPPAARHGGVTLFRAGDLTRYLAGERYETTQMGRRP